MDVNFDTEKNWIEDEQTSTTNWQDLDFSRLIPANFTLPKDVPETETKFETSSLNSLEIYTDLAKQTFCEEYKKKKYDISYKPKMIFLFRNVQLENVYDGHPNEIIVNHEYALQICIPVNLKMYIPLYSSEKLGIFIRRMCCNRGASKCNPILLNVEYAKNLTTFLEAGEDRLLYHICVHFFKIPLIPNCPFCRLSTWTFGFCTKNQPINLNQCLLNRFILQKIN